MEKKNSLVFILPVLFGFFVMGFCDIVGISSDYAKEAFGWSNTMAGFIPSMVFVWFLLLGTPVGIKMNRWGRKKTVMLSMIVTIVGMVLPVAHYNQITCMAAYALLGIGNTILQVSLNPLLKNVVTDEKLLTSSLTAGQVVKAVSSFVGPYIVLLAVNYFGHGDTRLWYYCFPILGAITLVSSLWLGLTPIPKEEDVADGGSFIDTASLLGNKKILLLFLGIFFVVGVDVSTNFISSKLMIMRFGWMKDEAGIAPQIYFISRTVGALLGVFLMTKIAEMTYFKVNIIVCIGALLALIFVNDVMVNLICIGAIGFLASCIFPIIFSMAVQTCPSKSNLISGLMITAVAGGGALTPIIGAAIDTVGITGGVVVIMACVFYLTYCAFGVKVDSNSIQ
jgi:MFS transporter, FHS family, L-fucose permease